MHRRIVFYVDPEADPLVEANSVTCCSGGLVPTNLGPVRHDEVTSDMYYRWPDGTLQKIDAVVDAEEA